MSPSNKDHRESATMNYFLGNVVCMKYNIFSIFALLKQVLHSLKVGGIMIYMPPDTLSHRALVCILSGLLLTIGTAAAQTVYNNIFEGGYSTTELARVDSLLEECISAGNLPGVVAGLTTGYDTLYVKARGLRRLDQPENLEPNDLLHLGSCAKAMTATLSAVLVENGFLQWQTGLEIPQKGRERTSSTITLHQLLSHTAGVPVFGLEQWMAMPAFEGDIMQQREAFTQWQLELIQTENVYSNAGYAMAASIAESAMGASWESLITEWLFEPLGITGVFGWPARHDPNQPWGHWQIEIDGPLVPHSPADEYEVPPIIAPAGDVSMSMGNYLVFLRENLRGLNGRSRLLSQETFEFLHTPVGTIFDSPYACGWIILTDESNGITLHTHNGSALTFYIDMVLVPEHDFAVSICTNGFSTPAATACSGTLGSLFVLHMQAEARRKAGNPDGTVENASIGVRYGTIQTAVDYAEDGEVIIIAPGVYHETIDLTNKNITLRTTNSDIPSISDETVIVGEGSVPVVLLSGNNENCILQGLTITGGSVGIHVVGGSAEIAGCNIIANKAAGIELVDEAQTSIHHCLVAGNGGAAITMPPKTEVRRFLHSSPNIVNCTIVRNGLQAILNGRPIIANSIICSNFTNADAPQISSDLASVTYSNIQGGWPGQGNIDTDPLFADPDNEDYHLKSQAGRWDPVSQSWTLDDVTSPCIDAGDPGTPLGSEPLNNGGIINMGAYGGTSQASMSP
jgi:CubicO group peptidase (beta-lactamase class C family)